MQMTVALISSFCLMQTNVVIAIDNAVRMYLLLMFAFLHINIAKMCRKAKIIIIQIRLILFVAAMGIN